MAGEAEKFGYGESALEQRRFNYVDSRAMKLITAASLEGESAESVRQAIHANHRPLVDQFRANDSAVISLEAEL